LEDGWRREGHSSPAAVEVPAMMADGRGGSCSDEALHDRRVVREDSLQGKGDGKRPVCLLTEGGRTMVPRSGEGGTAASAPRAYPWHGGTPGPTHRTRGDVGGLSSVTVKRGKTGNDGSAYRGRKPSADRGVWTRGKASYRSSDRGARDMVWSTTGAQCHAATTAGGQCKRGVRQSGRAQSGR
jgi:hypothetical protein